MLQCFPAAASGHAAPVGTREEPAPAFAAGVFLVDKPSGPSSFRMVQLVRRALSVKKVGHAGTLDPFASGLLVLCAGRPATRLIPGLMGGDKQYEALLRLGVETDTQDRDGRVVATREVAPLAERRVLECLAGFLGEQMQVPPAYSALKHRGKPLYHYARKGIAVEKAARPVVIHALELMDLGPDSLRLRVDCGKGTYVRTLAADIGRKLGCGAHLAELRRTRSGPFTVAVALDGTVLQETEQARQALFAHCLSVEEVEEVLAAGS